MSGLSTARRVIKEHFFGDKGLEVVKELTAEEVRLLSVLGDGLDFVECTFTGYVIGEGNKTVYWNWRTTDPILNADNDLESLLHDLTHFRAVRAWLIEIEQEEE